MSVGEHEDGDLNIFTEPEGFYQPEKEPTFVSYQTSSGQTLQLRLVGQSPLWGHLLWNGARTLATYLEKNATSLIHNKTILELGAGAGLPSLICALNGAKLVLATDYPDADLIENLQYNLDAHAPLQPKPVNIRAEGYLWGAETTSLLRSNGTKEGFDLLILGDLLFNHSEHPALLSALHQTLKKSPEAQALVFFTPYRPWLLNKDLAFFGLARESGFVVEKLFEKVMEEVMFEEDPGDERLRRTVFAYSLRWRMS